MQIQLRPEWVMAALMAATPRYKPITYLELLRFANTLSIAIPEHCTSLITRDNVKETIATYPDLYILLYDDGKEMLSWASSTYQINPHYFLHGFSEEMENYILKLAHAFTGF